MDKPLSDLDWSLVQAFLAVAEHGSLSAAARVTGISQPTLGRHIARIEAALGASLFARQPRGLDLTATGQALLAPARAMREAAGRMALIGAGRDMALEGTVRLTASMVVAHFLLPPIIARLRREAPGIQIELVPSDATENLLFREADIALRMYRPGQLDMIARHLGDLPLDFFAARDYLDRVGRPGDIEALLALDWVGYDRNDQMIRGMREAGWPVARDFFATRTDDQAANWQLVRAGCGVGINQRGVGEADPLVERLLPEVALPSLPVWLTAHEAMRRTPRVARVWQALAEGLAPLVS